jgi:hypothetical protein
MNTERTVIEHPSYAAPYISASDKENAREQRRHLAETASKEAGERDLAFCRALNGPPRPRHELGLPPLRQPDLPADFEQQGKAIDNKIVERGIAISRDRLLEQGRERFGDLCLLDRRARSLQRVIFNDLSSWHSVMQSFAVVGALDTGIAPRKTAEQFSGSGEDREHAARINGFDDLWKAQAEPESVRNVLAFHDAFCRLAFGMSMLDRLSDDGRLRSSSFCGGKGPTGGTFQHWLSTLEGNHFRVVIGQPLFSLLAWLSNEPTSLVDPTEEAKTWSGRRAPSRAQIKLAQATLDGFLLGHHSWSLWNYVGRVTRQSVDQRSLEVWRKGLAGRYRSIARLHDDLRSFFYRPSGSHGGYQFDVTGHRQFIDRAIEKLLTVASLLAAVAIEENKGVTVARFQDWLLVEGRAKPKLVDTIEQRLAAVFPDSDFQVTAEDLP